MSAEHEARYYDKIYSAKDTRPKRRKSYRSRNSACSPVETAPSTSPAALAGTSNT